MNTCSLCNSSNRDSAHFCANCRAPLVLQNKYHITRLLGRGGYGAVYQAEHLGLGGAVYAIKELLPDLNAAPAQQQAASDQFRLEASLLAKLNHPALPKVMDFFIEGSRDYLVMEYVEGETLDERLAQNRGPLPEAQVLTWAEELCDALTYLHTRQPSPIIHRDIKPVNVKLTPEGSLKLLDFGIAKIMTEGRGTVGAARAVSPPYSPMEQYGTGTDARSDIYALGVTLYQLLTRELPPDAPDRAMREVVPPRRYNPQISVKTEAAILKAIAEKVTDRFQRAADLRQALHVPAVLPTVPAFPPETLPVVSASRPVPLPSNAIPSPVRLPAAPPPTVAVAPPLRRPSRPVWLLLGAGGFALLVVLILILALSLKNSSLPAPLAPPVKAVTLVNAIPYQRDSNALAILPVNGAISETMHTNRPARVLDFWFELANAAQAELAVFISLSPSCDRPIFVGKTVADPNPDYHPVHVAATEKVPVNLDFCVMLQAASPSEVRIAKNGAGRYLIRVAISDD